MGMDTLCIATRQMSTSHTAIEIKNLATEVFVEWTIPKSKVVACVTDGVSIYIRI